MKLVITGSDHFRFLFVDLVHNSPVLFVYSSTTDTWQSIEAREPVDGLPGGCQKEDDHVFLHVINGPHESVVTAVGLKGDADNNNNNNHNYVPMVLRRRLNWRATDGFMDRLQVYGDGNMLVIKSNGEEDTGVPCKIKEQIKKPYRVMKGCLERGEGVIRAVLFSNYDGLWDIIWLSYDMRRSHWTCLPLPDSNMKGLNMAGIAFSSGLTLL
ncbi:unnamed protein product [Dovyalis caffra]|uniref:F-box/kelch-repeat protein n=1 Tax=Dovyalis caffra TaxID=77055 RepID=A0AAV1RFU8_9ROSI|nr:unnamed protein product [Dovyalis caffra]